MAVGVARERWLAEDMRAAVGRWLGVVIPLALLVVAVRQYQLESGSFVYVTFLAFVGFVIHSLLPLRQRLPFFALLSLTGIAVVMGIEAGLWLIAVGLVLIGICHLPLSYWTRVTLLLGAGVSLVAFRETWIPAPWTGAIWPILGSMFMFRLLIYMYDLRHDKSLLTPSSTLSYFFMLPNVVAPLFPVVDYRTFRRTYYNEEEYAIYQKGVTWMFRGVVHLILYRFVYYYLTLAPEQVQTAGDFVQFVVTNYMLYLRISGLFHLFIGMMHLFGFNLPETHHLYFLASSFTDYWRRINIYWKDFMMKIFYYPSFFWLRRFGGTAALILATLVVFVATMVLHSYQWYWIRGSFVLSTPDAVFWTILAVFVVINAVWEAKKGRKRRLGKKGMTPGEFTVKALKTAATFTVLCVLWSLWQSDSVGEWLALWKVFGRGDLALEGLGPVIVVLGVAVGTTVRTGSGSEPQETKTSMSPAAVWHRLTVLRQSPVWTTVLLVGLLVMGHPRVLTRIDSPVATTMLSLREPRLNRQDQALLERGYYENLLGVERFNPELWKLYAKRPSDWRDLWETEALRNTDDFLRTELVPSTHIVYKSAPFTTNQWGMRDRDYTLSKPDNTFRVAMLGASPVLGSGVADNETFESLVEERLNEQSNGTRVYEILNLASEAYGAPSLVRVFEAKALPFDPDAVFYVDHEVSAAKAIEDVARRMTDSSEIIYPELQTLLDRAGVRVGMNHNEVARRLVPLESELMSWAYRKVVADARAREIVPVWVFLPMPTPGADRPCPPERSAFCFGSATRPGAAADQSDPRVANLFRLAQEAGFVTLDLSGVFDGHDLKSFWIAEWDGHPNAAAHRLIADRLYDALEHADPTLSAALFADRTAISTLTGGALSHARHEADREAVHSRGVLAR